jgi:enterochelin esterase family protein
MFVKNLSMFCLVVFLAHAQQPQPIQSPEVHSDGRVTFRFLAPNAQKVSLSLEGGKAPLPMQKDEQGIWIVTTGTLTPDLYGYSFQMDGTNLLDPMNTASTQLATTM